MTRRRSVRQLETLGAAALVLGAAAASCTYDFDQFVREPTGGASSAGHGSVATGGTAGHGGASGRAGTGGQASPSDSGGAADAGEGGASAASTSGGTGATAGAGGTANGGGGTGGKPSDTAGKTGSSGKANAAGQGGVSGAPASAGAGGKPSTSCSGTSYGGHCYFLIGSDTGVDWPSAKSMCEAYSTKTHLVTITSSDEQAALAAAFFPTQTDTWIGLSLADPSRSPDSICKLLADQCPFQWVTGEALSYTDWAKRSGTDSEPNYTGSCVRLQAADETWADTGCTGSKYRAICEED
ncbi:MAG TPA: C-type lectin domain-containing protein [Polyangiaceae bacterium]|nr:C-type lectin domain-containing protein [Polyangiaceae bacterium]